MFWEEDVAFSQWNFLFYFNPVLPLCPGSKGDGTVQVLPGMWSCLLGQGVSEIK